MIWMKKKRRRKRRRRWARKATFRTRKRKTKKKMKNDKSFPAAWHLRSEPRHRTKEDHPLMNCQRGTFFVWLCVLLLAAAVTLTAQDAAPLGSATQAQDSAAKTDK